MLALLSFGSFIYRKRQYYVIVNSEYVMQSWPFGKQIKVAEITSIKYFSEDYIIRSDTDEIRINTNLIEEDALETLKSKLLSISSNLV